MKRKSKADKLAKKLFRKAVRQMVAELTREALAISYGFAAMGYNHRPGEARGARAVADMLAKRGGFRISAKPYEVNTAMTAGPVFGYSDGSIENAALESRGE